MQEPSPWKKTILAAMTSYIDAGSIVAGAAGLSLWQAYLGMSGLQMGLLAALSSNAASAAVGFDLSPAEERPVLTLSPEALPALGDEVFRECWILSPDFRRSFRPAVGDELKPDEICSWQCLHLVWL